MPKRLPSTIAIAANLADDMISRRIDRNNNYEPADDNLSPNPYVQLKQDIDERLTLMGPRTEKDGEVGSLRDTLETMSGSLERALNSAYELAFLGNTVENHEEFDGAQKALKVTANDLKEFKQSFQTLQENYPKELEEDYMRDFMSQLGVEDAVGEAEEAAGEAEAEEKAPEPAVSVLKYCGETKSAYEWIEASKQKLHSTDFEDELDAGMYIARIVAARQLANAERKNTDNLKNFRLSEGELDARAYELLETPAFVTYLRTIGVSEIAEFGTDDSRAEFAIDYGEREKPYLKFFGKRSHGGALEDDLKKYLGKRPDSAALPDEYFGRYKDGRPEKYSTYGAYIERNKRYSGDSWTILADEENDQEVKIEGGLLKSEEKPFTMHDAARMAAAYQLSFKDGKAYDPIDGFREKRLEFVAGKLEKDPVFRLAVNRGEGGDALKEGRVEAFYKGYDKLKSSFRLQNDKTPVTVGFQQYKLSQPKLQHDAMKKLYRQLLGPSSDPEEQAKYVKSGSKKYQAMVAAVKNMVDKDPEDVTSEDRMKVFASTVNYQEGREKERFWSSGQNRFNLSLDIGRAAVSGTYAEEEFYTQLDHINKLRGKGGLFSSDTRIPLLNLNDPVGDEKNAAKTRIAAGDLRDTLPEEQPEAVQNQAPLLPQ